MVSDEERQRKASLMAQYADVTDEEDKADEKDDPVPPQQTSVLINLCSETPMWKMFPVLGNWRLSSG
ncbi:coiled-coil domain-containing protein 43 [Cricetulus griseus]|nr:coiled-coil domain-containing protein 43 [Cricetulus griseus]